LVANSGYTLVASSDPVTVTASAPIGVEGGTGGGGGTGMPTYTYDAVGNRLTSTDILGTSLEYEYEEDSNRLLSISGDESRTYSYDAMGNTTGYGAGSFTYNDAGRLVGAGGREYFYNGLGQRVRKKLNSTDSIYYVYDEAGHLLGEYDTDGELIQETVWFGDIPVATLRPDGSEIEIDYVHADHLNTPRVITQSTNNDVRWRWDDQGFGDSAPDEDPESLGAFEYSLRFPGQQFDDETALHYNYFRDYDPAIGRYIESDPIGQFGGVNTYGYVSGDPASGIDPYGLYKVYGNWCGPDWTGGLAKPWNDLTESERETVKPPIDQLDGACRDHDQCYGKCGTDYPCDPSGRSRCFRSCDTALTKQANAIGGFWGSVIGAAIDRPGTRDPGPNAKCCESGTADK